MYDTILSHPIAGDDRPRLVDHHRTVAERSRAFAADQRATAPDGTDVSTLVSIAAFVHDLGKAHPEFQAYLRGERSSGPSHAPFGALAAFHAARQRGLSPVDATIPLVAVARHHQSLPHAETPYEYVNDQFLDEYLDSEKAGYLRDHFDAIDDAPGCREAARESYARAVDGQADWEEFTAAFESGELADEVEDTIWRGPIIDSAVRSGDYYAALLQTWSTLVLADKSDAAGLDAERVRTPPDPPQRQTLESRVAELGGDSTGREATLDELRDEAFTEVNGPPLDDGEGRVHQFIASDEKVATLALPTGLGKTYTGLGAALSIRDALGEQSTVVYCLPYTSIIDQTASDVEAVFGYSPTGERFTVDHYLEDTVTQTDGGGSATSGRSDEDTGEDADNEETTDGQRFTRDERFLGESWQANLVVTTFVQLFESLLGPSNSASTKLPNLTNSVVVLDEPQALPLGDWDRIRDAVDLLTSGYDARVLLMTATQPRIFAPDDRFDPFPLVADSSRYFQSDTERVSYAFDASAVGDDPPVGYESAAADVLDATERAATLAICNTIPSARELAWKVAERAEAADRDHLDLNEIYGNHLSKDGDHPSADLDFLSNDSDESSEEEHDCVDAVLESIVEQAAKAEAPLVTLHLTTRHRPVDRERLLAVADRLTERDVPFVFVATQLVEAGVDVSFQRVFRDFAPLDSIVQAAGRCNRNFERDRGRVTVWQLAPVNGDRPPSESVYASEDDNLLSLTTRAVRSVASLPSDAVAGTTVADDAVDRYYELVAERNPDSTSEVQECQTQKLNEYTMIDERCLRSRDVVVCRTPAEVELAERTRAAFADRDFGTAFDRLDRLADRTVSVPIYTSDPTPVDRQTALDPTETVDTRWIEARKSSLFDARDGLTNEESVEDYLL